MNEVRKCGKWKKDKINKKKKKTGSDRKIINER